LSCDFCYTKNKLILTKVGYLPSKKIVVIGIVAAVLVVVMTIFQKPTLYRRNNNAPQLLTIKQTVPSPAAQDSDGDGLKDWEEILWKTDPKNPDSDNDGTPDGEEVALRRNPVLGGPDDKIEADAPPKIKLTIEDINGNLTTQAARVVFNQTLFLSQKQGGINKQADMEKLVAPLVDSITAASREIKIHTEDELIIADRDNKKVVRQYGNNLGALVLRYSPNETVNEVVIFSQVMETGDYGQLKKLDPTIEGFENILANMGSITVPKSAVTLHLHLLNNLEIYLSTLKDAHALKDDPLRALVALKRYEQSVLSLSQALKNISQYFKDQRVAFSQGEPGYILANFL
jgi:hypothetical protein